MPSETTLNAKNLAALGAERLTELMLEMTAGGAAARRRLRLEPASLAGGDVASEIRKRLVSMAKSHPFVDRRKVKELARGPRRAARRSPPMSRRRARARRSTFFGACGRWRHRSTSDTSNGAIGSVIASARDDLGGIAAEAGQPVSVLADRVFAAVCANDYGQFDDLISMAQTLGPDGLHQVKAQRHGCLLI